MKKKIIVGIIIAIVAVAVIVAGVMAINIADRAKQEQQLIDEINALTQSDIMTEDIDMTIKTTGDFAVVETTIKEYLQEVKDKILELTSIYENETVINSMSVENLKEDGPEFTKTKEAITSTREAANKGIAELTTLLEESTMTARIEEKGLSTYYVEIFNKLMYEDDATIQELEEVRTELNNQNTAYISMLDKIDQIIALLSANPNAWRVTDSGEVEFSSQSVLNQYNDLVTELTETAE